MASSCAPVVVFLLILVLLCQCGGVGGVVSTVATGGTSGGSATSSAETLSEQESGLYEAGPVDLPVTIAKLETPDVTKIIVSADAVGPSLSAPLNATRLSTTNPTVAYTITGAAGAVHDPDETPYVYFLNDNNDTDEFCEVESDGRFSCALLGDLGDDLYLFASTTSDLSTAEMSPPLHIVMDDFGVVAVGDTNSTNLSADYSVATDNAGNYYLIVVNKDDGGDTSNFYRRNVDGTLLQTIWTEDDPEGGKLVPTRIEAINESFIVFFDQDGQLHQAQLAESSASIATSFVTGKKPRFTLTTDVTDITSVNDMLVEGGNPGDGGYRLQIIFDEETGTVPEYVIAYYPYLYSNNESGGAVLRVSETSGIINTSDSLSDSEIIPTFGLRMKFVYNTSDNGMAFITDAEGSIPNCHGFCLGDIIRDGVDDGDGDAFDDMSITSAEGFPEEVRSAVASPYDTNYIYVVALEGVFRYSSYSSDGTHFKEMSRDNIPTSLVISNDDRYVVGCCNGNICGYSEDDDDFVIIWDEDLELCDAENPPEIDTANNIHFYDSLGQHRGIYQLSNASTFSAIERRPPRALGACGFEATTEFTDQNWSDLCKCWINFNDLDELHGITEHPYCGNYHDECVAQDKDGNLGECYYYLRDTYDELDSRF